MPLSRLPRQGPPPSFKTASNAKSIMSAFANGDALSEDGKRVRLIKRSADEGNIGQPINTTILTTYFVAPRSWLSVHMVKGKVFTFVDDYTGESRRYLINSTNTSPSTGFTRIFANEVNA